MAELSEARGRLAKRSPDALQVGREAGGSAIDDSGETEGVAASGQAIDAQATLACNRIPSACTSRSIVS